MAGMRGTTNCRTVLTCRRRRRWRRRGGGGAALVLVDVQADFCAGGALAVPDGDAVVAVANALRCAQPWSAVALTQDWHPPRHSSFASTHGAAPFSAQALPGAPTGAPPQVLWPDHCVQGGAGAAFHAQLARAAGDVVVRKGTVHAVDSYSGFGDAQGGAVERTPLEAALRARGVADVLVAGLALDFCVAATCIDAARAGFGVACAVDAARAISAAGAAAAAARMRAAGVLLLRAADVPTAAVEAALAGPLSAPLADALLSARRGGS
jgi:nicotinamidase/pyrazinamidase